MTTDLLPTAEFYTHVAQHMRMTDPRWEYEQWSTQYQKEETLLSAVLGPAQNRTILDCTCGNGAQAVALARLSWRVTATDITTGALAFLQERAHEQQLTIETRPYDVREVGGHFSASFDWVLSCMALDNLPTAPALQSAFHSMYQTLKHGGQCYIRLRDLDHILDTMPRYEIKEQRTTPQGVVLRMEDWERDDSDLIHRYIFLHQEATGYSDWNTYSFAHRRRGIRKADVVTLLQEVGFTECRILPQVNEWHPYSVIGTRP